MSSGAGDINACSNFMNLPRHLFMVLIHLSTYVVTYLTEKINFNLYFFWWKYYKGRGGDIN